MARKNFVREKRIYCGKEWLEVDIVPVTNMPEVGKVKGKGSSGASSLVVISIRLPFLSIGRKILFTRNAPNKFTRQMRSKLSVGISKSESSI